MVSTSNQFALDGPADGYGGGDSFEREWHVIDVETDEPVVWTVEVDLANALLQI
jgi:hypothetical protein